MVFKPKKQSLYILFLLLIGVVCLMLFISKCSHGLPAPPFVSDRYVKSGGDTLDVAIEISPLSYRMTGDSVAGLDYEIMNLMAERLGRPVRYHVFSSLKNAVTGLEAGIYDIVISSLPSTESLKNRFRLSEPLYLDYEVLVQKKESSTLKTTPQELADDTVWIADGSPVIERIQNLSQEIGETIHVATLTGCTSEHLIMLVANGSVPRAVVNKGLAVRMHDEFYPELDITTPISFTRFQSWIVSERDPAFADRLDSCLIEFKATDDYQRLLQRY
ncbi:MAG: transporter substrate-binding domain-containing protein [Muribaculaceae bacterium]|nr:transporter substrate-binding domain-containing protein [Muribaculaceae bacterium]